MDVLQEPLVPMEMIMARAALIAGIVNLVIFIMFGFFVVLLVCP